ncbi:alpha/beta hydrolase family protein [Corynebacterium breve]|uniref:Alpha/beta hydrolase family protein n=1 Tax=Corynebacterium breve TaxID=3049799 RepID=A0ABY8VCL6_9CORY|nr:alpha/beta hydrolase family protein [Corynebacterium breve]WIM67381.1 alpha/beta hydrolase family protein [Corynebacterium breve]
MRKIYSTFLACAVTTTLAAPGIAQERPLGSSDGLSDAFRSSVAASSQAPGSSAIALDGLLSSLGLVGSSDFDIPEMALELDDNFPYPIDETITEAKLLNREVSPTGNVAANAERRLERWTVSSPSMGRDITVDVRLPGGADAPIVVLLDGVSAPINSGWLYGPGKEEIEEVFGDEHATLVFPVDANGTWYSDWIEDDPVLGRHKWETFIVEELLPLVEAEPDTFFNGHRAIGGLSMGASGAVHLANSHPELFDATFGFSGCYSTSSRVGEQIVRLVTETRGGTVENMWGPVGSEEWDRHDVSAHPEGLRDMAVYLSAADGGIDELPSEEDRSNDSLIIGAALENGVYTCTRELDRAMRAEGMDHHVVNYKGDGVHDWRNFEEELAPAWEHIRPSLY